MKVLMLNTFDEAGGAARAALRLLGGVRAQGIGAELLVQFKSGNAAGVICNQNPVRKLARRLKLFLGLLPVRLYPNKPENNFSPALLPDHVPAEVAGVGPDIIHLHWLGAGFLSVETISRFNKPLVWTLHDSWAFTGGCHVPFECKKYRQSCGGCPVLGSSREKDLSRWTWHRKERAWRDLNLTVVTPSRWLAECVRASALFREVRVEVIPNGLDIELFQPRPKEDARDLLGLPHDKKIILFGAMGVAADPNKGFHLLQAALRELGKGGADLLAVIFGAEDSAGISVPGMPVASLGRIHDDHRLAALYAAADLFVAPSLLENLPNTVMEAMACGTPCVAFNQGGMTDLIDHEVTGYLAQPYEAADLANGMQQLLEDDGRRQEMSARCRRKVEETFALDKVAFRYAGLYRTLLEG
jgi:glycosyltransferase involved in cell wall biosynthesis